ncbi:hypothetical protein GCM10023201_56450 [Actinomycetospora corticicola]|uniref:4-amino-4-deoxy-L-arabinose transferase-like glycosyltransferase n=1 Tax=Actinomycetospora corticicola TaxID=663602 RepID=A0A7Y9J8J7_9PSEU|nr:hypothetical protein [Actinomycetospora corticicola]NYD38499.1 hypothetical protein [Actinomycetospora corticicola]
MTMTGGTVLVGGVLRRSVDAGTSGRRAHLVGAALGGALGAVVWWIMHDALGDDALISVAYARTLAESGTWGVFPGITANTQTSPLNVWLLAGGMWLLPRPIVVVGLLLVVCLAVLGWLLVDLVRRAGARDGAGWLAVAVVGTSPVLASTVGLEAYLGATVLVAVCLAASGGRVVLTGLGVGLAVLTRPDLAVPAGVLALALVLVARRRVVTLAAAALVAAAVALPWHVWSWFALGDAVPDTTWVRTGDRSGSTILGSVPGWIEAFPAAGIGSVLPVAVALGAAVLAVIHRARAWARTALLLVAAGWAHLGAMETIHAQGAGWYYAPVVACSAAAAALAIGALAPRRTPELLTGAVVVAALGATLVAGPVPWRSAPLVANMALTSEYAQIGQELSGLTGGRPVQGPGELGALAFHSTVPVLDFLSEPARTDAVMARRAAEGGLRTTLMRWSTEHRRPSTPIETRWRLRFIDPRTSSDRVVKVWPVVSPRGHTGQVVLVESGP